MSAPALERLCERLDADGCDYRLIAHPEPIASTADAARWFDVERAAPTLVTRTDRGPVAFVVSSGRGRLDLGALAGELGLPGLRMANRTEVLVATGHDAGAVPLVGHDLPCVFDNRLLAFDHVYGGSGDPRHTLRIAPADVRRLSRVIGFLH